MPDIVGSSASRSHRLRSKILRRAFFNGLLATKVTRGENSGSILQHTWVVRHLMDLGEVTAEGATLAASAMVGGEHGVVALLTDRENQAIIGSEAIGVE